MVEKIYVNKVIGKKYIIPDFQRDYAWTEKNLKKMLDDIKEACIEGKEGYLLGSIVISVSGQGVKVIDGQQRLTSLKLVLKALGTDAEFLAFENRRHVEALFAGNNIEEYEEENDKEENETCIKIYTMYQYVKSYFNTLFDVLKEVTKEDFSNYLMNNVWFVEKTLAAKMQIQHSFEVLNTAGEQLKPEDIAKAKLIAEIETSGCELLNFAWLLCYDIENDLPPEIISKSKDIIKAENLSTLFEKLKDVIQTCGESVKTRLLDVVNAVEGGKVYSRTIGGRITDYQSGVYATCLTPYELIDVALKSSIDKSIADIKNSDTNVLKSDGDALKVIKSLLLYRIAFDSYVVRRTKGEWNWFLSSGIKDDRFIKLESMLAVSGVDASKNMVDIVEKNMETELRQDKPIDDEFIKEVIKELEQYSINRVGESKDENLNKGTGTDHFVFHWLDYLLYINPPEEIKEKATDFVFKETTSVEHFMPQQLLGGKEHPKEWKEELNNFGNLALITPSSNSRLNNSMPSGKVELADSRETESLKYSLMLSIAKNSGWEVEASRKHGESMKELLKKALENKQAKF